MHVAEGIGVAGHEWRELAVGHAGAVDADTLPANGAYRLCSLDFLFSKREVWSPVRLTNSSLSTAPHSGRGRESPAQTRTRCAFTCYIQDTTQTAGFALERPSLEPS